MADVRVDNVTKKYGDLIALNGVTFECREGEFFTLLGPSGAGKTSMLELIAGIKKPTSGRIYIADKIVNELPPQERNVAMAFENYALYSHLDVYENIAFPLRSPLLKESISRSQERSMVEEIACLLGIESLLSRKPQQLSGGQKQRVSLARTMVRRPDVYLLDEPIAHLDAKLRTSTRATLKRISNDFGTTIIYVTHNYREALALSDRILILREGVAEQIDVPEMVFDSPKSDFVSRLLGEPPINLMDGVVLGEGEKSHIDIKPNIRLSTQFVSLDKLKKAEWYQEGKRMVRVGIRPHNIKITSERNSPSSFDLPIYAVVHEAKGSVITFDLKESFLLVKCNSRNSYHVGQKVWLEFDPARIYIFKKTMNLSK